MEGLKFGSLIAVAVLLTACQGQDPFDRKTNPVSRYENVRKNAQPYMGKKAEEPPPPEPEDYTQRVCDGIFKVSVEGDRGANLMEFVEGVQSSYKINVRSFMGADFAIEAQRPAGSDFRLVQKDKNVATYQLTWKPGKYGMIRHHEVMTLHYRSAKVQSTCGNDISVGINVEVLPPTDAPTIAIDLGKSEKISFGETVDFTVNVNDPASTPQIAPQLAISFAKMAVSGERVILDASQGVDCADAQLVDGTRWQFKCVLSSSNIQAVDKHLNSGRTLRAVFFATAESQRGQYKKSQTSASVQIEFPNVKGAKP